MHEQISLLINNALPDVALELFKLGEGDTSLLLKNEKAISKVMNFLKKNKTISFDVLETISVVDYIDFLELNYFLTNFNLKSSPSLMIKVRLFDRINPNIDTISSIYSSANFLERECFDMFGITFNHHPDHRRILCPDDWQGFPLRKDYVPAKFYQNMELFPESKMNMEERSFKVLEKEKIMKAKEQMASQALGEGSLGKI
jgi:NADH-quinone oxidoreductase subunit C